MGKITEQEYTDALKQRDILEEIIQAYHKQREEDLEQRLKDNPIFSDDELIYSAITLCPCGYGLAHPKNCGMHHYWSCAGILKGIADVKAKHSPKLSFIFHEIKSESEYNGTTRGEFKPEGIVL